jgi:hypothetical protein
MRKWLKQNAILLAILLLYGGLVGFATIVAVVKFMAYWRIAFGA